MRWLTMALCILLAALGMSLSVPFVALAKDSEMRASDSQYSTAGGTVSHKRDSEQWDSAADYQYAATERESAADSQYADNSAPKSPPEPPPEPSRALPADSRAGGTDFGRSVSQGSVGVGPVVPAEDFPVYSQVVDNSSLGRFVGFGSGFDSTFFAGRIRVAPKYSLHQTDEIFTTSSLFGAWIILPLPR